MDHRLSRCESEEEIEGWMVPDRISLITSKSVPTRAEREKEDKIKHTT